MQRKFNIMNNTLLQFKKNNFVNVNHKNSKKYHDMYLELKNNCNITTLEYYQNEIYNDFNNIFYIDYSYNCLNFICEIYNCSYYNFLLKYINCDNCAKYIINNFNDKPIKCMIKCDKCIESENIKNLYYEKLKLESIEKNRRNNKIIEKQEHKKLLKLEKEYCKCNILLINFF